MKKSILLFIAANFFMSGCFLNPYSSDFSCPKTENGKCVNVHEAYGESLEESKKIKSDKSLQDELKELESSKAGRLAVVNKKGVANYQEALYAKLAGLLSEPSTPMVAPPQVMRVLLFPYRDDSNKLYMPRFVYMFIDGPQWVLDEKSAVTGVE